MFADSTCLASFSFAVADTLERVYEIDPGALLEEFGMGEELRARPGVRLTLRKSNELWDAALALSDDSAFGINVGRSISPSTYYVLGHAWLASCTLKDAFRRLIRYGAVIDTNDAEFSVDKIGNAYRLHEKYVEPEQKPPPSQIDASVASILVMCEAVRNKRIYPIKVALMERSSAHLEAHRELFNCPIEFGADHYAMWFEADEIEAPLETAIPDIARASDRIAANYIEGLDHGKVSSQVRELLIQLLPAGSVDQGNVASRLYRSASTLQRQLNAEGTSYRDVLESTRKELAQEYLRDREHTQAQIAFLLGFSDQSNFARAFKRWTGQSPGRFQKAEV